MAKPPAPPPRPAAPAKTPSRSSVVKQMAAMARLAATPKPKKGK